MESYLVNVITDIISTVVKYTDDSMMIKCICDIKRQDKTYCRTVVYAAIGLQRFCSLGNDAVTLCVT